MSTTSLILLNLIPTVFVLLTVAAICWLPSRLRHTSDARVERLRTRPLHVPREWEEDLPRAA